MPTQQELMALLTKLEEAVADARAAATEAHQARKDLMQTMKEAKAVVPDELRSVAREWNAQLADEVRSEMVRGVVAVIERMEADWRARLGLEPG